MTNKQGQETAEKTAPQQPFLDYNINATYIHYILHNLFRALKPVRRKYNLTINEIIFLNGTYLYCKHVSTCVSQDACLRFIGYYNLQKIKYYIGSLQDKGMIHVAEIIHKHNRYKLTQAGIEVMNELDGEFHVCLYDWCNKYGVEL
jgi:hypothetical protein